MSSLLATSRSHTSPSSSSLLVELLSLQHGQTQAHWGQAPLCILSPSPQHHHRPRPLLPTPHSGCVQILPLLLLATSRISLLFLFEKEVKDLQRYSKSKVCPPSPPVPQRIGTASCLASTATSCHPPGGVSRNILWAQPCYSLFMAPPMDLLSSRSLPRTTRGLLSL